MPALSSADVTIGAEGASPSGWEFGTEPYDATAGQVVTAPAGITSLRSFTLWLEDPPAFSFRAYVYAWSGTGATGPALYESGDLHTPSESSFEAVPVTTGGVAVTPGQQYVLFLSRSAEQAADAGVSANDGIETAEAAWIMFPGELPPPYTEGKFVFLNNGYDTTGWTTRTWFEQTNSDARFEATFDTPAPVITPPAEVPGTSSTTASTTRTAISTNVPAAMAHCVVPDLDGLTLAAVKSALSAADCTLGKVQHHWFSIPAGELMEQNAHHGTILPAGSKVGVWLSRGPHPRTHRHAR